MTAPLPSLSAEEKARILQALREDAAFREEMRRLLLEEVQVALQELRESIEHLALTVREQAEATDREIRNLAAQVQENSRQIAALTGEIRQQRIRLDDVSGAAVEASAREEILIWLRSRGVEIAEQYLPGDLRESLDVRSVPDGVLLIRDRSGYIFLVYEVTFTIALRDVRRIAEWLEAFRQAGWPAVGLVYYRRALPEEDEREEIVEENREIIRTIPGMKTLREEAARAGVLLMQRGTAPWRPQGWRPPRGMEELPEVLPREHNSWW